MKVVLNLSDVNKESRNKSLENVILDDFSRKLSKETAKMADMIIFTDNHSFKKMLKNRRIY